MTAIEADGLTKVFDKTTAVDQLSFSVEDGELFGLLGPNGAGKSTLINMLVTLLRPTTGTATVNGHDIIDETSGVRDSLGIVFQEPALDDDLTGEENLAFHGRMYGMKSEERAVRIEEVLELVGLAGEGNDPVGTYSGGMKRRLEIGRGLLHEPTILFLDEPTAGLDAGTRRRTWEYIEQLNKQEGVTIVLTTHYIEEADFLCDRVAIIDDGQIAAIDSPESLKESLGGEVIRLDVKGDLDELSKQLANQSWVREFAISEAGINVTVKHGSERIPDLVRLSDSTGVTINSVEFHQPNLETVFLSLTGATISARESPSERTESSFAGGATGADYTNDNVDTLQQEGAE